MLGDRISTTSSGGTMHSGGVYLLTVDDRDVRGELGRRGKLHGLALGMTRRSRGHMLREPDRQLHGYFLMRIGWSRAHHERPVQQLVPVSVIGHPV